MRKVLLVLVLIALLAVAVVPAFSQGSRTIVDIAARDSRFSTLVAAVTAADLVDVLAGEGPFTVFAPTNAAFAALPAGTVEALLADIPALTNILTYHVVAGEVPAAEVVTLASAPTVQGAPIFINVVDGGVVLNGSVNVTITDIRASNGIIHVIDAVLLPPAPTNQLRVFFDDTPVLSRVAGEPTGNTVRQCQTWRIDRIHQNFGRLTIGGWVNLGPSAQVAEDYGLPGGQPRIPGCE
ncbi:MAG: fasciclin domain-containing protein [Anaerolinea sp.]